VSKSGAWSGDGNYLVRLRKRMEQRGFHHDDPLYVRVVAAHEQLNRLRLEMHYLACDRTGRHTRTKGASPSRNSRP
jgi:hypothetical protein